MRLFLALLLAASSLTAGVSYDFKSVTAGKNGATLAGAAAVEGKSTRIDFTSGDNLLFKSNTTLLSNDGGKTYLLIDPAEKSYYQFSFDQLLKSAGNMLKAMGGLVQMSVTNQKVNVKDAGVGEPIEGYPTRKQIVTSSYDMSMKIMGMNTRSKVQSTAETWYTDKIPSDSMTFIQQKGLRTGFDDLDKLIEAQSKGVKGFPLKQVMTMKSTSGKQSDTTVTTTTISKIRKQPIPASRFAVPGGFVKKESPTLGIPGLPPVN